MVNIVEAGADPTGKQDVAPVIDRELKDNTLLVFPKGRYKLNSQIARRGNKNMGLIGQNAVLTHGTVEAIDGFDVTAGEYSGKAQHFKIGTPERPHQGKFVFGGFTADWRGKNTGMQIVQVNTAGVAEVSNVRQVGVHDLGCQGPFRLNPTTKDARVLARNIDIRAGGLTYQKTINTRNERSGGGEFGRSWSTTGVAGHPEQAGYIRIQNVHCGGWPDNGIYQIGGKPNEDPATVEVVGCVAANSHPSNIRIGGKNSKVINCTVVTDEVFDEDFYFNQRPIRLDHGSCTVKNSQIIQRKPTGWSLSVLHQVNQATIKNVSVTIYNKPQTALVIDEAVPNVTVNGLNIKTVGWNGSRPMLIRGDADVMKNVSISSQTG
ncbi:hypothetical protein DMJ13_22430 [halophilic archaeon]|nr:hypothetical protein DMJ13_22430 [halophilic archaeon]